MNEGLTIVDVLSYRRGWEILQGRARIFEGIQNTLASMSAGRLPQQEYFFRRMSPYAVLMQALLRRQRWSSRDREAIVKDGFSIQFLLSYVGETGDLADMVESTDEFCSIVCVFSDEHGVPFDSPYPDDSILTFAKARTELSALLPSRGRNPFILLGVSRVTRALTVTEVALEVRSEPLESISRSIEFSQEFYQAGVGIISYFGQVLKQKHPELRAKVRIEQEGSFVRLHIESASGDKEVIEKTLLDYGLVIAELEPPSILFDNKLQILELEQKLALANMEVSYTKQLLALAEGAYSKRIGELQDEVHHLRTSIGRQLTQVDVVHSLLARQNETTERLLLAQISHSSLLVSELAEQARNNRAVFEALTAIDRKLAAGITPDDEHSLKEAFAIIHREEPATIARLQGALTNISYGVSGNYVFQWLQAFLATL